jgi:hypothetical protein
MGKDNAGNERDTPPRHTAEVCDRALKLAKWMAEKKK